MKKRLFMVLAVLALTVCLLPMVVGAEATDPCAQGHTPVTGRTNVVEPTCQQAGLKEVFTDCSVCGKQLSKSSERYARLQCDKGVTIEATEPGCLTTGRTEGKKCSMCGAVTAPCQVIPQLNHNPKVGEPVYTAPTCQKIGTTVTETKCDRCGDVISTKTVRHAKVPCDTKVEIPAVEPGCLTVGYTAGAKCSMCGKTTIEPVERGQLDHKPVVGEPVYTAPTCQKIGTTVTETKCDRCGDVISTKTVRHAKVPCDTKVEIPAVEPGCLTAGNTAGAKCSMCGKTTIETKVIPQLNHDENFKIVRTDVKAASCSETGSYREGKECRRCGKVVSKSVEVFTIAKLPHTEVKVDAVAATCQKSGLTEGKVCSVCNTVTVEQKEVKPLEHKWDEGVVINNVTTYTCTVCGTTYEEETPVLKLTVDPNLDSVPKTGNAFIEWLYALIAG